MRVEEIPGAIHQAMRQMNTGRPRPTEVEIPWDILRSAAEVEFLPQEAPVRRIPDRISIQRAVKLLAQAKKPFIWAGGGAILADASPELRELAEFLGAPVGTTAEGKGSISEDHPLSLGGGYYGFGASRWALPQVDVALAIGTRLSWLQMRPGTALKPPQKLIQIDADPAVIGKAYPADVSIVADARIGLKALLEEVRQKKINHDRWSPSELDQCRKNHQSWLQEKAPLQYEIIKTLRKNLADDAIVVSGVTNIGYWANLAYAARRPRTYITSSYFDQAFGSTKSDQMVNFNGRIVGTELNNPDFSQLAELFGAKGLKAKPEQLGKALDEALEAQRPVVIEVPLPTLIAPFQIPPEP
jgi:acetolactate synthase-1/2/3 large subunit